MKLKSLLLGSAAALVAVTGAQAADMPIAEPVEYVRICDAFGTGFFYIPGTDTCLKISGYVRIEVYAGDRTGTALGKEDEETPSINLTQGLQVDSSELVLVLPPSFTNNSQDRWTSFARGALSIDARRMTDVGLLRLAFQYLVNVDADFDASDSNADSIALDYAFIQLSNDLGTLTVGHTGSFFNYKGSGTMEGTGANDANTTLIGYSFNVGNGISFSIAVEDSDSGGRNGGIQFDRKAAKEKFDNDDKICKNDVFELADDLEDDEEAAVCYANHDGDIIPDITGNIRLDQAWGSIQIMGALHHVRGVLTVANIAEDNNFFDSLDAYVVDAVGTAHDDAWGWAFGAGGEVTGGVFSAFIQGFYGEGVGNYFWSPVSGAAVPEGVFTANGSLNLPTVWLVNGAITAGIGGSLTAVLAASYGEFDGPGFLGTQADYDEWAVAGDLIWTVTSGFTIGLGVVHWDNSITGDGTKGRARFQANF
jgi:hypothetical protein